GQAIKTHGVRSCLLSLITFCISKLTEYHFVIWRRNSFGAEMFQPEQDETKMDRTVLGRNIKSPASD
ncbi:hypothetical protein CGG93_25180, partial [Vibrio parahaemolyticus]